MGRLFTVGAVLALLAAFSAPTALALPATAPGGSQPKPNGEPVTISAHGGIWSAIYVEGDGHFLLTHQEIEVDGELLLEIEHPGHTNLGPIVDCWLGSGEFFPGQTAIITFSSFFTP